LNRRRFATFCLLVVAAAAAMAWRGSGENGSLPSLAATGLPGLLGLVRPTPAPRATQAVVPVLPAPAEAPEAELPRPAPGIVPGAVPAGTLAMGVVPEAARHPGPPGVQPAVVEMAPAPPERPYFPARPRQLTFDGCCAGAWWADDSAALHVLDRPAAAAQTAIYRLPLWPPGAPAEVLDTRLVASDERFLVRPAGDHSIVQDRSDGRTWPLPTGGGPARVSPDGSRVVWWDPAGGRDRDTHLTHVFGAAIDGSGQRDLGALWGAEVVAFLPDNRRVLVRGRPAADRAITILATLDVDSGHLASIARGPWLTEAALAPGGGHVAYTTSLDRADPAANGVWLVSLDGGGATKLPFEGAYRWRDAARLLYVPMILGSPSHEVWQYDVGSGTASRLLDPEQVPLRIANNDWSVSPDGHTIVWRSADDGNLWLADLPY
jgi:hypothetical protein